MDLNDAIAELQGKGDWFADEFEDFDERLRSPLATILNAALSGALIPRPAANGWRPIETAPRDGTWFRARTEHGTERVVHFADEADRYPISHDGEAWSTAPVEWTPVAPRPAEPAQAARVDATDDATAFERADWFWRTMDPDDCGDSPEEAINRAMVGRFCVCEIASSYKGPTRYGFIAPVADPESDDEEFVHFATHPEAIDEARSRALIAAAQEGRE